jgi:peptidyl-prolyl cis-trans isomerase C
MLARLIREPFIVFMVAGASLFALHALLQARHPDAVRVTDGTRAQLAADFAAITGREPGPEDLERLVHDYVADELLFREALQSGLHLADGPVRNRLIEVMRHRIAGALPDPTEEQLVNHYAENLARYRSEATVSFSHVFFRDRPVDGDAILAQLARDGPVTGEPFHQGREFPGYGTSMIRAIFGRPFLAALQAAPLGQWSGPLQSSQGWHFVHPTERQSEALLPFPAVREQVENDLRVALIQQAVDAHVAGIERRGAVRVER